MILSSIFVFQRFRTTASSRMRCVCPPGAGPSSGLGTKASLQSLRSKPSEAVQDVGRADEGEHPAHFLQAAQLGLREHPDDLQPDGRLLVPFPLLLADAIVRVPCGA